MPSRRAFTLIELMIVIAIIAILASIAIPNLMESRISAQEAAGASTLRSGMLPAQIQFQAGAYCDLDGNGIGTYAVNGIISGTTNPYNCLCGNTTVGTSITLNLLPPAYGYTGGTGYTAALATGSAATVLWPTISGYFFKTPVTQTTPAGTSDGSGERTWGVLCGPLDDNQGRRWFSINQAGNVYMCKPTSQAMEGCLAANASGVFGTGLISQPSTSTYLPVPALIRAPSPHPFRRVPAPGSHAVARLGGGCC